MTARPQLTQKQQRLLQLQASTESLRADSPLRASQQAEIASLKKELGPLTARRAKAEELIRTASVTSNLCTILNPTKEGLVLTVSVVGDTEQLGSRRASDGAANLSSARKQRHREQPVLDHARDQTRKVIPAAFSEASSSSRSFSFRWRRGSCCLLLNKSVSCILHSKFCI